MKHRMLWPIHSIVFDWGKHYPLSATLAEWHQAIDTFGPPGTFQFPYILSRG